MGGGDKKPMKIESIERKNQKKNRGRENVFVRVHYSHTSGNERCSLALCTGDWRWRHRPDVYYYLFVVFAAIFVVCMSVRVDGRHCEMFERRREAGEGMRIEKKIRSVWKLEHLN